MCLDCSKEKQGNFELGKYFNLEADHNCTYEIDCNFTCDNFSLSIFINLKKRFKPQVIRDIYDGILLLQKESQSC